MISLKEEITIQPPPFTDASGKVVNPREIKIKDFFPNYIDNTQNKVLSAQIPNIPYPVVLYANNDYPEDTVSKKDLQSKLEEFLSDNPAQKIRSLYPKTLEETPNSPGTILSGMIKSLGIVMTSNCSCRRHALKMNEMGNDWCEENIDTIVGWLREEASRRKLPFIDAIGKLMVGRAIKKSRKLLANLPVPENDEDLDKE